MDRSRRDKGDPSRGKTRNKTQVSGGPTELDTVRKKLRNRSELSCCQTEPHIVRGKWGGDEGEVSVGN